MNASIRPYSGPEDFLRVRDFLKSAYYAFGRPTNWGLDRWNWGRYHPLIFSSGRAAENIAFFEGHARILEAEDRIIALLNTEDPRVNGQYFIQRLPEADPWLDELIATAEGWPPDPASGLVSVDCYDHDAVLRDALRRRGFVPGDWTGYWSEQALEGPRPLAHPPGFRLRSMAESGADAAQRCRVMGLGFDHPDPADWMRIEEYRMVQEAPDYLRANDLVIESPDGQYASHCIVWYDDLNRFGVFEPVCTIPEFRLRGLGRAVIQAGLNRLYELGARKAYVGSGQDFYAAIGFARAHPRHLWHKLIT